MRVAVIGAGIIGVTTAFELAVDGHEVTVFERRSAAAEESSFANAGVVAPGYTAPWAAPGMPAKVARFLLSDHAPVRLSFPLTAADIAWMWQWYRSCDLATYNANRMRMQRLAFYSRTRLHEITEHFNLEYDRSTGYMVMLRGEKDRKIVQPGLQVLRDAGVTFHEVDAEQARKIEPALNTDTEFAGAIHLPQDEVGNCRQFALLLKNECQARGVTFEFNSTVAALSPASPGSLQVTGADGSPSQWNFNAVVVCGGVDSARLLAPAGLDVPLASVWGYSISAPIREPLNAPRSGIMDERFKVAITRMGNRVRVAGSAEIGGAPEKKRANSIQTLYKVLHDWFPGAAQLANTGGATVQEWKGARPMLPDGPPLIGATGIPGVWINLGHGSSGWALSCGSARVIADLMSARRPDVDIEGLGVERLAR
jgi:D-amino-acid dehydrogenase